MPPPSRDEAAIHSYTADSRHKGYLKYPLQTSQDHESIHSMMFVGGGMMRCCGADFRMTAAAAAAAGVCGGWWDA